MERPILKTMLVLMAVACGSKPAAAPPPAAPSAAAAATPGTTPAAPSPPPPPDCKSLDAKCQAAEGQALDIGGMASVRLPAGWTYASTDQRVTGVSPEGGAIVTFMASGDSREAIRSGVYAILAEFEISGVVDEALNLDKPLVKWPAEGLEVQAWQVEKPKRGTSAQKEDPLMKGQPGALLVGVTRLGQGHAVVGVGFLPRAAPSALAPSIADTMKTIRPVAAPAQGQGT